jgi:hypothetical protein
MTQSWSRPLVIGAGVASLLFFLYAMYVFYADVAHGDRHLQKRGTRGTAVVLEAKQTRTLAQTGQFDFEAPYIWKYKLRVTIPGKEPYEASCSVARDGIAEGSTVDVAVSKLNHRTVTIMQTQSGLSAHGADRLNARQALIVRQWTQGGGLTVTGSSDAAVDHVDALAKLAALHQQGALTDDEFATEKTRLLGQTSS